MSLLGRELVGFGVIPGIRRGLITWLPILTEVLDVSELTSYLFRDCWGLHLLRSFQASRSSFPILSKIIHLSRKPPTTLGNSWSSKHKRWRRMDQDSTPRTLGVSSRKTSLGLREPAEPHVPLDRLNGSCSPLCLPTFATFFVIFFFRGQTPVSKKPWFLMIA